MTKEERTRVEKPVQKNEFVLEIGHGSDGRFVEYISLDPQNEEGGDQSPASEDHVGGEASDHDADEGSFERLLMAWVQSCHGFLDAFPLFSNVMHYLNHKMSDDELVKFLDNAASKKRHLSKDDDNRQYTQYTLGREHLDFAARQVKKRHQFDAAEATLSKAQLLAVVAEYEAFVAELLAEAIAITPETFISSAQKINATDIIKGEDLDQIRASIIEDYITDLQRHSHVEVIKTIFQQLKLTPPDDKSLREFGEICLRRNLLTHANGVVNSIYRSEMLKLGYPEAEIPDEGEKLVINDKYMRRSISRIFQMGYFTGHLVWQHLKKTERENSIRLLINHSHDFLVADYTKICGRICEFGLNRKSPAGEIDKAFLIINLALSFQLNDSLDESEKKKGIDRALARRDWSIVDSRFEMALCCVNEDYEKFGKLFDVVKDRDFGVNEFMSFAIFSKARSQPIFKEKMLQHYGVKIGPSSEDLEDEMRKED